MSTRFYHPRMYAAEHEIAARIRSMLKTPCDAITPVTDGLKGQQPTAVEMACRNRVSLMYGSPGTGKTTTSNKIVRSYDKAGMKGMIVAPTGKAAKRANEVVNDINNPLNHELECMTIHRALEYNPGTGDFEHGPHNPFDLDYIVCEEWSMADCAISADFLAAIDPRRTRLLFLGDPYQLPSVGPGNVLHDFINSRVFPRTELVDIYRQGANSGIAKNARRILQGEMVEKSDPVTGVNYSDFFFVPKQSVQESAAFILDSMSKIPAKYGIDPIKDIQVLSPGKKSDVGTTALNKALREKLNPGRDGYGGFRLNDKIINRKNIKQLGVVNGDVGTVIELGKSGLTVDFGPGSGLDGSGFVEFSQDQHFGGESLHHAYCFTIHSSQGSEFPVVLIPCHTAHYKLLVRNLIYTGLTRAKILACIIGDINALKHAIETSVTDKRITGLQEWLRLGMAA